AQNLLDTIVPDLASEWSWNEDGTVVPFKSRQGVKWNDGKPFTACDVKCTCDLLQGKGTEKLRINPRKSWYQNLAEVTANGDDEASFHLKRPQPSFIGLLASGWSPVYPCHIPARDMRQHPVGTGPFKFVEFKPNESIKLTKNPDYWKPCRRSTIPTCGARSCWRSTARPLSTSSAKARARSARRCSHRRTASGACRRRCCAACRAMTPMSQRTAHRRRTL